MGRGRWAVRAWRWRAPGPYGIGPNATDHEQRARLEAAQDAARAALGERWVLHPAHAVRPRRVPVVRGRGRV